MASTVRPTSKCQMGAIPVTSVTSCAAQLYACAAHVLHDDLLELVVEGREAGRRAMDRGHICRELMPWSSRWTVVARVGVPRLEFGPTALFKRRFVGGAQGRSQSSVVAACAELLFWRALASAS